MAAQEFGPDLVPLVGMHCRQIGGGRRRGTIISDVFGGYVTVRWDSGVTEADVHMADIRPTDDTNAIERYQDRVSDMKAADLIDALQHAAIANSYGSKDVEIGILRYELLGRLGERWDQQ